MKQIKDKIAALLYKLLLVIVKLVPAKSKDKHLLIIKLDEIGDFMLFRNYLKYFKQSPVYKDHKITLVGNAAWRPIFEEYDLSTTDETIWVSKKQFNRDLKYRLRLLMQVRKAGITDVVNCVFSRSLILDDGFALVATGKNKTAMVEDKVNTNRGKGSINLNRFIYNRFVDAGDEKVFDSLKDKQYLSEVLQMDLPFDIRFKVSNRFDKPAESYYVIFIGAGMKVERKWPTENFVACAEYIRQKNATLIPVVCGGPTEVEDGKVFMESYSGQGLDYTGKTSLPQFIEFLGSAAFLLSVDTGPVHMASGAGCPVVALYSGVHYGRYAPYPKEVSERFYSIYPDFVDQLVAEKSNAVYDSFALKNEAIRTIPVSKVLPYLDNVIPA